MAQYYRDLKVWQKAIELVTEIYQHTSAFPKAEMYGITSQIRRSAISIASNIAEGAARESTRDFLRFISIADGSLAELETQLIIAKNLEFLTNDVLLSLEGKTNEIGKMLNGLQKSLQIKLTTNPLPLVTPL